MSGPSVYFGLPDRSLFTFPPEPLPHTLPPPVRERTFRSPFGIAPWLFNNAMRPEVPFTFAAVYILAVFALNAYNRSRGNRPWWIARQKFFTVFVVVHNVALALYSFATFLAMTRAIVHTWPGFDNPNGAAGIADALCKAHGPRGLGDAVNYNSTINIWESKNQLIHVNPRGTPDATDVGRLWTEGLAFWGWIFYLSKFYEVLDTFIIVAKGKRSPTLQTYHHAGAMLCMWAGIRYMSPPIWMFVFINSFIHALMYTYFTLAALDVRVNKSIKRALTTMQIAQFVFGASYAAIHLFVKYDIPIATPYKVAATVASVTSHVTSAVTSATSEISQAIETPTATASVGALIKKYLLRAAGEEGIAERVGIQRDVNPPVAQAIQQRAEQIHHRAEPVYETKWRTDYTRINCIDTSGEAFAIYLNIFYLLPLTVLFGRFFYKAYIRRVRRGSSVAQAAKHIPEDARKAEDETEKAIEEAGKRAEDQVRRSGSQVQREVKDLKEQLREDVQKMKEGRFKDSRVSERVQNFEQQVKDTAEKAKNAITSPTTPRKNSPGKKGSGESSGTSLKDAVKDKVADAENAMGDAKDRVKEEVERDDSAVGDAKDKANDLAEKGKKAAENAKESVKDEVNRDDGVVENAKNKAKDLADQGKKAAENAKETAKDKAENGSKAAEQAKNDAKGKADQGKKAAQDVKEDAQDKAAKGKDAAQDAKNDVKDKADQGKNAAQDAKEDAKPKSPKKGKKAAEDKPSSQSSEQKPAKSDSQPSADTSKASESASTDDNDQDEDKENQPPAAESQKVTAQDEPESKQDENISESQAVRPGTEDGDEPSKSTDGKTDKDGQKSTDSEPASKQDANLEASEPTRPGTGTSSNDKDNDADTDAMGQSGAFVDYDDYADAVKEGEAEGEGESKAADQKRPSTSSSSKSSSSAKKAPKSPNLKRPESPTKRSVSPSKRSGSPTKLQRNQSPSKLPFKAPGSNGN